MPTVARIKGIIIEVRYKEHGIPHYHALYGKYDISISIETNRIIVGRMPSKQLKEVLYWASKEKNYKLLMKKWKEAKRNK